MTGQNRPTPQKKKKILPKEPSLFFHPSLFGPPEHWSKFPIGCAMWLYTFLLTFYKLNDHPPNLSLYTQVQVYMCMCMKMILVEIFSSPNILYILISLTSSTSTGIATNFSFILFFDGLIFVESFFFFFLLFFGLQHV